MGLETMETASPNGPVVHLRYRNRSVTTADLEFLNERSRSTATCGELVRTVCSAWQWRQANGGWSLHACADLLLRLEERGLVKLPPGTRARRTRGRGLLAALPLPPDLIPLVGLEVRDPEADLDTLCIRPIASEERLGWRVYMDRYHYLGDRPIVGEHVLYAAFLDGEFKYPAEYAEAGRIYSQVFDNDDKAKALDLNPIDRMVYHRRYSKPLMLALKKMCEEKIASKSVEPNSPLWEPVTFILNQWERLTLFCEAPGVPLDTNLVEQVLIMPGRYLAGSFNYHTEDGAQVGDHAMSIIATARAHRVEPVAYLTECLRSHEDLAKRPEHFLPWVYRERNSEAEAPARSSPREAEPEPPAPGDAPLRDLAPEIREDDARRVAASDQNLQLAGEQSRATARVVAGG